MSTSYRGLEPAQRDRATLRVGNVRPFFTAGPLLWIEQSTRKRSIGLDPDDNLLKTHTVIMPMSTLIPADIIVKHYCRIVDRP